MEWSKDVYPDDVSDLLFDLDSDDENEESILNTCSEDVLDEDIEDTNDSV